MYSSSLLHSHERNSEQNCNKMTLKQTSFFLFVIFTTACRQTMAQRVIGKWQAVAVASNGQPIDIIPEAIILELLPDKTYRFQSTLNYTENGKFSIVNDLLYTQDMQIPDSPQRVVQLLIADDTQCQIRMKANGTEQIITMKRIQ